MDALVLHRESVSVRFGRPRQAGLVVGPAAPVVHHHHRRRAAKLRATSITICMYVYAVWYGVGPTCAESTLTASGSPPRLTKAMRSKTGSSGRPTIAPRATTSFTESPQWQPHTSKLCATQDMYVCKSVCVCVCVCVDCGRSSPSWAV